MHAGSGKEMESAMARKLKHAGFVGQRFFKKRI
jgi:hypothetical protein